MIFWKNIGFFILKDFQLSLKARLVFVLFYFTQGFSKKYNIFWMASEN